MLHLRPQRTIHKDLALLDDYHERSCQAYLAPAHSKDNSQSCAIDWNPSYPTLMNVVRYPWIEDETYPDEPRAVSLPIPLPDLVPPSF